MWRRRTSSCQNLGVISATSLSLSPKLNQLPCFVINFLNISASLQPCYQPESKHLFPSAIMGNTVLIIFFLTSP